MDIISRIKNCTECKQHLPFTPRPVLQYSAKAKVIIIGQAPGIKAHDSEKPWNDASGERLRTWMDVGTEIFYHSNSISIVPMGFCYPGKGKSGDLPPRPECTPKWHPLLINESAADIILLIGKYAQDYYLQDKDTLTNRLRNWQQYLPNFLLLPHPSPRNNIWLKKHSWFEEEVLPQMQEILGAKLKS